MFGRDERAVSGLVGYVVVFTIALAGAVVLTTAGITAVFDAGAGGHSTVPDRDLRRIDTGVGAVVDGAPHREIRLDLDGNTLRYGPRYTVRVTARGGGVNLTGTDAVTISGHSLRYEAGDGRHLVYAGGLRGTDDATPTVDSRPAFRLSQRRSVLDVPVVGQAARSPSLVSGSDLPVVLDAGRTRTVERVGRQVGSRPANTTLNITVDGRAAGIWGRYFRNAARISPRNLDADRGTEYAVDTDGDGTVDRAGGQIRTRRLFVRIVPVSVALDTRL